MNRYAVTIWELLLVLVIIAVMVALLFPVFQPGRRYDPHRFCASNLKQIGLGIFQYTQDNNDCLPNIARAPNSSFTWRSALQDYVKSNRLYQCPSRNPADRQALGPDGFPRSYAANYTGNYSGHKWDKGDGAFAGPGSKPVKQEEIDAPDNLIALCEVSRHSTSDFNIDNIAAFDPHNRSLWAGHTGGSNYLLTDGHVKWLRPLDTKALWHRDTTVPLTPAALALLSDAQKRAGQ